MDDKAHNNGGTMGGGGMMNMNMTSSPPPSSSMSMPMPMPHRKMMMHMTFYWGKSAEILFSGWPGVNSGGMYTLSLLVVFLLAVAVEWVSRSRFVKPGTNTAVSNCVRTLLHAVRMGLAYLVMLAVMSFNGGIFIAAVAGHAVGFLVFGTRDKPSDLPPVSC